MTYKDFLKQCKIKPDLAYMIRAHKWLFKELRACNGVVDNKNKLRLERSILPTVRSCSCLIPKWQRQETVWVVEDAIKAFQSFASQTTLCHT